MEYFLGDMKNDSHFLKEGHLYYFHYLSDKPFISEIMSDTPGVPIAMFSISKDELPKLRIKINKPKKPGLSSLLQIRRRHSLASSDSPIDLFGLLPKGNLLKGAVNKTVR